MRLRFLILAASALVCVAMPLAAAHTHAEAVDGRCPEPDDGGTDPGSVFFVDPWSPRAHVDAWLTTPTAEPRCVRVGIEA